LRKDDRGPPEKSARESTLGKEAGANWITKRRIKEQESRRIRKKSSRKRGEIGSVVVHRRKKLACLSDSLKGREEKNRSGKKVPNNWESRRREGSPFGGKRWRGIVKSAMRQVSPGRERKLDSSS